MRKYLIICVSILFTGIVYAQHSIKTDEAFIRKIYTQALENGESYQNLRHLCKNIGSRLSGSENAEKAVQWGKALLENTDADSVWLQPVMVPHWVRGKKEKAKVHLSSGKRIPVNITALGNSVGSGKKGVKAQVVEVGSFAELQNESRENIEGKIVFINDTMPREYVDPARMYGSTAIIRYSGPGEASKLGAIGVITRSLNSAFDDFPHTGTMSYGLNVRKIPAAALSTEDSNWLSRQLMEDPGLELYMETHCEMKGDVLSHNVVAELKGTKYPDEIILVGGHLDSWDLGEGAHDDGSGVVHAHEALRILKALEYKPAHTIRVVFFMNEENGLRGGKKYAELAIKNNEKHIAALESDIGGFLPLGFNIDAEDTIVHKVQQWKDLFTPYHMHEFQKGYGGADINPLKNQGVPLFGLWVNTQNYFKLHHSALDTFDKVVQRELEMGCAAMASMIYLIDQHGL